MPGVATVGTVAYNGVVFPPALSTKATCQFVKDATGRKTKYLKYRLTVEAIFSGSDIALTGASTLASVGITAPGAGNDISDSIYKLLYLLGEPGKTLEFTNQGLGLLDIDKENAIVYGPSPEIVQWEPVGSNKAVRIVWSVEWTTNHCWDTNFHHGIAEFSYSIAYSVSKDGASTRTISGTLEVAKEGDELRDINDMREYGVWLDWFPLLEGFSREQSYTANADKRTYQFTITDTEIPSNNAYYPYMVNMDVTLRVSSKSTALMTGYLLPWNGSLSGTITVAPRMPKTLAWNAWFLIVKQVLAHAKKAKGEPNKENKDLKAGLAIVTSMSIEDQLFGRSVSFDLSYMLVSSLETLLESSGLFQPLDSSWEDWRNSMKLVYRPIGTAGLTYENALNAVISLCEPLPKPNIDQVESAMLDNTAASKSQLECPPAEKSWLTFDNNLYFNRDTNTVFHVTLGQGDSSKTGSLSVSRVAEGTARVGSIGTAIPSYVQPNLGPTTTALTGIANIIQTGANTGASTAAASNVTVQDRGASTTYLIMEGHGVRVGYKVPIPELVSVNGQAVAKVHEDLAPDAVVMVTPTGCTIYMSRWRIVYRVVGSQVTNITNPQYNNVPDAFKD